MGFGLFEQFEVYELLETLLALISFNLRIFLLDSADAVREQDGKTLWPKPESRTA